MNKVVASLVFILLFIYPRISFGQEYLNALPSQIKINESADLIFTSSNLPILIINTNGQTIPDDHKITADMGVIYNGEGVRNYLTDPFNNYSGKIGIEIRGSSSQMFPKKQYAVETRDSLGEDLKVQLLGFPEESDWVLYAPYSDKSLVRDVIAYKMMNDIGRYASRSKFCEVVLNNQYIGVYVLFEKIKRDPNRVNIKKLEPADSTGDALTGGYIIKIDKPDGEGNDGWTSQIPPHNNAWQRIEYQYHYPKPADISTVQKNYIKNFIFSFEVAMYGINYADTLLGYPHFLGVNSYVDYFILNETVKNVDSYRLSAFMYKDRDSRNPKMFMGPVWDYNISMGNGDYYNVALTSGYMYQYFETNIQFLNQEHWVMPFWWRKLIHHQPFADKVHARWNELKNSVFNTNHVFHYIDSLVTYLNESQIRNYERWPILGVYVWPNAYIGQTYNDEINYLKQWLTGRFNWLNQNMIGNPTDVEEDNIILTDFSLEQNFPNPFNPSTKIKYHVGDKNYPSPVYVILRVYDILGNEITTLVNAEQTPGTYEVEFGSSSGIRNLPAGRQGLASGIYYYTLQAGSYIETKKMILIK